MRKASMVVISSLWLLAACGRSDPPVAGTGTDGGLVLKAETALPPGQSGFFSAAGQAQGLLTGNPADFGAHVDDQRLMYWGFDAKPGALGAKPGTPLTPTPRDGVEIYRDSFGVPIVYAPNVRDLWFGVGYAIAQDRLFFMDAIRRTGAGTLSELTGCGGVPADLQQRVLGYTDAEYQAFFDRMSQDSKDSILGYVDGVNAWRAVVMTDPSLLPAEYVLLSTTPAEFAVKDVLTASVYMTRYVASEGGSEFRNIAMLKELAKEYGSAQAAKDAFLDMVWLEDSRAVTTIPLAEGRFTNQPEPADGREAVFNRLADWALSLPDTLARGPGTGNSAAPVPCSQPTGLGSVPGIASSGQRPAGEGLPLTQAQARALRPAQRARAVQAVRRSVVAALMEFAGRLHGGSMAFAIGTSRTRDHGTLMLSGPQLDFFYPSYLTEYEIHSGDYNARGSSVPMLPVVGIGYTDHVAWGLTTGYSKTVDSFIETICSTAQIGANTCKADQYFHQGQWKDMSCRTEVLKYRPASQGLPFGTADLTSSAKICRTVHGPIVARDDAAGLARSLQYAMWMHEVDTIEGVREWNRLKTFDEFRNAVAKVTWNENVTVATRDGHIAYFHPGLFPARNADTDMRLPTPGTGEFDLGAPLPFEQLPHVIDPVQGFVANWNTKPAFGWLDGEGLGDTARPGGHGQRVTSIQDFLATRSDWSFADLRAIDAHLGTTDHRAREYLPLMRTFRNSAAAGLSELQKAALDLILGWDRSHFGPGIDLNDASAKDGPAATVFGEYVGALRDELFASLKTHVIDTGTKSDASDDITIFNRLAVSGSHVFDQSVMDNLILRIFDPASSSLLPRRDYTGGRSRDAVMLAALDTALSRLATTYNGGTPLSPADLSKCTRVHPRRKICSLTGVIGPGAYTLPNGSCVTMPYQDRGTWVHRAGYEHP